MNKGTVYIQAGAVEVQPETMPAVEMRILCRATVEAAKRFYADPANRAAFEAWQSQRHKRQAANA